MAVDQLLQQGLDALMPGAPATGSLLSPSARPARDLLVRKPSLGLRQGEQAEAPKPVDIDCCP